MATGDDSHRKPSPACPPAFLEFYNHEYGPLMKILLKAGARWEEAEDACEAVMIDLLFRWQQVEDGVIKKPQAYARLAARRWWLNSRQRDLDGLRRSFQGGHLAADGNDDGLCVWEEQEWVQQLLDRLPPAQREVMELEILGGLRSAEIAEVLGKTPAAVRKNRQSGREKLREFLKEGDR